MKFSIVTPSFNGVRYIREAIDSVLLQEGDFDIHYHVQDGGSSDGTIEVLKEYAARVADGKYNGRTNSLTFTWTSEKDSGMYDAINRGFQKTIGDICAWINSDDRYMPGAFQKMSSVFDACPEVKWLKGVTEYIDEQSRTITPGRCYFYDRDWIADGVYGKESYFIEQDSVFWRRSLWDLAGPIRADLRLAGDFELWTKFAHYSDLCSVNIPTSSFRKVSGQLSENLVRYRTEMAKVIGPSRKDRPFLKFFFRVALRFPTPILQGIYALVFRNKHYLIELNVSGSIKKTRSLSFFIPKSSEA